MKTPYVLVVSLALGLSACTTADRSRPGGGGTVEVAFQNPSEFTDLTRSYPRTGGADEGYLDDLRRHLTRIGASRLPAGYTAAITITDVDMAGDFEPQMGPDFSHIRIVKPIYPPRISLEYRLTGPDGAVVSQGERRLSDTAFNWNISPAERHDPLRHEKALLDQFLSSLAREI